MSISHHKLSKKIEDLISKAYPKKNYVLDGAIDPAQYIQAEPKVLFLLKNPFELNSSPDLQIHSKLKQKKSLSSEIINLYSICAYGIIQDFPYYEVISLDISKKHYALHSIALCYLDKTLTASPPTDQKLLETIEAQQDLIKKQIQLLNPDIILSSIPSTSSIWSILGVSSFVSSGYEAQVSRWLEAKVISFPYLAQKHPPLMTYCLLDKVLSSYAFFKL